MSHFVKERLRECEVPHDWHAHCNPVHVTRALGCNYVVYDDLNPCWLTILYWMVKSEAALSKIVPPSNSLSFPFAYSRGVSQYDGFQTREVVLGQLRQKFCDRRSNIARRLVVFESFVDGNHQQIQFIQSCDASVEIGGGSSRGSRFLQCFCEDEHAAGDGFG